WFNDIDVKEIEKKITITRKLDEWTKVMKEAFKEFYRIIKPGGYLTFEVGEVRKGKIKLDEEVVPIGAEVGFEPVGIVINLQEFTKTANIWGIENNEYGTNTNRIVLFKKNR
ncbi:MAG: site-specific DNA-methyltransferase, partial [Candidatus Heimdallarchaeaceae archaeon]